MPRFILPLLTALLLCVLLPRIAHAADTLAIADDDALYRCKKFADGARIRVTLKPETTLQDLVAWAMGFSCKSFLYGNGVGSHTSKITVMAPTDMTPKEAYRLFLVSLSSMNLTVVPHGRTLEIVEQSRAKESPLPIVAADALPGEGGMVRMIVRPRHIASTDMAAVLSAVKSPNGQVLDVANASVVVITDDQPMLARMLEVATLVDVERRQRILRIELKYADVDEAQRTLSVALGESSKVKLLPDARGNALLVIGPDADLASISELVRVLDVPGRDGASPRAHVVRLEHADAEETAGVLGNVFGKNGNGNGSPTSARPGPIASAPGSRTPPQYAMNTPAPGASTSVAAAAGDVRISFAKSTNVLIVIASDEDFRSVRDVVRELDVQRPQVYVEALIMDVSVARARQIGVSLHGGTTGSGGALLGSTNQSLDPSNLHTSVITSETAQSTLVSGLSVALLGPSFNFLGVTVPSLGALFQAARTTSDLNVLSSPQLMATDHEQATLKVGENVPTPGTVPNTGTSLVGSAQSVQRVDLNLEFKVKPHIGSNGDVTMEIELEIKEPGPSDPTLGASWTTRAMKTLVTVKDQQPIVLGGLMSDRQTTSQTSVPVLGDIPILGVLFRRSTTSREKRNLMIVLVPYVVMDAVDARKLMERKLRERQEFESSIGNLDAQTYEPHVDYGKKRGLVAEINHQVEQVDAEEGLRVAPPAAEPESAPAAPGTPAPATVPPPAPGPSDIAAH